MRGVGDPRTVEVRKVTPNLILKSAAVFHSTLEVSVMSDLLSFGLQLPLDERVKWVGMRGLFTCRWANEVPSTRR